MGEDLALVKPKLVLRVTEALLEDVETGVVRLDPRDIVELGALPGDVIEIAGKRATVAKVTETLPEYYGQGLIQMDGLIRENAQAGLDGHVEVRKVSCRPAEILVIAPADRASASVENVEYFGRILAGLPVAAGDKIKVNLFGRHGNYFTITGSTPDGPVMFTPATQVHLQPVDELAAIKFRVSYEQVGGLERELQTVREMIELPLRYPRLFAQLNIDPPKGVLLYGPPGTGKTLIARAVASEVDAHFIHVNGPEIIHKFYGESEAKLREVFDEATKNAPSIIFLDEVDAIAPKRAEVIGDVEKRVVAQLLALMDGLVSRGDVVVIGATNLPELIDPALRRPGRFDREVAISVPNRTGRRRILQIHTKGMPLAEDVDLERLAQVTHGFVGADLEALCKEAGMLALRETLPQLTLGAGHQNDGHSDGTLDKNDETMPAIKVAFRHFLAALKGIEPTATREFFAEKPNVGWKDVGGLDEIRKLLLGALEWPMRYPKLFARAKLGMPRGILLTGPSGTGKTLVARALAGELEVNFITVEGPALFSKWLGESERALRHVFKAARQAAPCILFFDEIDALAPVRGGGTEIGAPDRMVSQLINGLDSLQELDGVVVLGATNRIELVDPALLRPGRFDYIVDFPVPDQPQRLQIFEVHTAGKPLAGDVNLDALSRRTEGLVGADIEAICKRAALTAIEEYVASHPDSLDEAEDFQITMRHLEKAIDEHRRRGTGPILQT
ncbi:MAG: CDC48 family AAA ATPase [Syntrophothermus sp.]